MRIPFLIAVSSLCLFSGCALLQRSDEASVDGDRASSRTYRNMHQQPIEELAFEEDAPYLTAPPEEGDVELIEDDVSEQDARARHMQQARYGVTPIYFAFDDYAIREDQQDVLDQNAKAIARLTRKKRKTVVIEGHADCFAGSPEYNMQLSEKRAQAVKDYLVTHHRVPEQRLKVVGRGATMCIVPSGNKEQQAPNRRVEFHVLD